MYEAFPKAGGQVAFRLAFVASVLTHVPSWACMEVVLGNEHA